MEFLFIFLFRYLRQLRSQKLQQAAEIAAKKAKQVMPIVLK